jgi:hypothetical protein
MDHRRVLSALAIAALLVAAPAAHAVTVSCALNGSVTLANPNPGILGSSVTAVPSHGVVEQSVNGNPFFVKSVGDPISWAANSIVNYRNTSSAATDQFSIGGFVFDVTIGVGSPPTPTTTTTSDVTITFSAGAQAIGVSAHVSPTPPSGTITFAIPGAGSSASATVNAQGNASGNFIVAGGTPSGNYTITATFNGPANYTTSNGTATLHINFYATTTTPPDKATAYSPNANGVTLSASVTSQFGGTVNTGKVTFTVMQGPTVIGSPVLSNTVASNAASATYTVPAGTAPGDYSITAAYGGGGNFDVSTGYATLTVSKASQTITFADPTDKAYGTAPFALTATGGASGNAVTFAVASGPGSLVGSMLTLTGAGTITIHADQAGNANYAPATQVMKSQNVTAAPLTVTATSQSKLYGAAMPALTFTAEPFVNGDTAATALTGSLATAATASSPVGLHPITQGTLAAASYAITYVGAGFTITKAPLTVTADSLAKLPGASNPPLTYTTIGFVDGDDASVVSGTPSLSTTAMDDSPAGVYPITITAGTLGATNYAFLLVPGTMTVGSPTTTTATTSTVTTSTVTTTTVGGGVTTTTLPGEACATDAAFPAIECRLDALADAVRADVAAPMADKLTARIGKAMKSTTVAEDFADHGKTGPARRQLKRGAKQMKAFVGQLGSKHVAEDISSATGDPMVAEAGAIGSSMTTLRTSLGH